MNLGAPLHKALQALPNCFYHFLFSPTGPPEKFSTVPPRLGRKYLGAATLRGLALFISVPFSSVAQSCLTLCDPTTAARQASLSIPNSRSLLKLMSIESVMPSNRLILCCPPLLLPSISPSIRVFPNESVIHIRWPKYWSFCFSISYCLELL